ncbi:MAG: hypothetical protein OEZ52_15320, partial [Candidatus Aminicenantes bacterium]|nr:hypothetical protein [Candidatus Aminicenantes bacterium]
FGWEVVQALVSYNRKGRPHFREVDVSTEKRGMVPTDTVYGVVEKKIECPNCHGTAKGRRMIKEGKECLIYTCGSCGKQFDEEDLITIEMEQH